MARTKIDIWNSALARIGSSRFVSDDLTKSPEANYCRRFYDECLRFLLRRFAFSCCCKRAELQRNATDPVFEYTYAYDLPNDYIRVIYSYPKDTVYSIEGRKLLTDADEISIKYVYEPDNIVNFTPDFENCVVVYLAARIALPLSNSPQLSQSLLNELYTIAIPLALGMDNLENNDLPNKSYSILENIGVYNEGITFETDRNSYINYIS